MNIFSGIRYQLKKSFDRLPNERIKKGLLQALPFWVASLLTGVAAVLYAKLFVRAEETAFFIFHHHGWWMFVTAPTCFIVAWWLVKKYAPFARGSGIPQVMAAIEMAKPRHQYAINKLLSLRVILVKVVSSLFMILGGGIVGREGPTIQVAGSIFRKINQWLPAWWPKISKHNMIMTGAAAGLAAAFNTPLGGIVFAVEELTKTHISFFKTAVFSGVLIAGLTAQALLGPYLYLGYPNVSGVSSTIFFAVMLVSIVAGLAGGGMSKLILLVMKWKSGFVKPWQSMLYVVGCALVIVSIAFFADNNILGSGKNMMTTTLFTSHKFLPWYTPFYKAGGLILSFTTGAAGGVFAPSLGIGAAWGSVMAGWLHLSETNTNLVILAGMVGFLTGVTRSPFTSAILVLEMTDRHNVIFHLLLAGMVASLAALLIDQHSLYDHLKFHTMKEVMTEEAETIPETATDTLNNR